MLRACASSCRCRHELEGMLRQQRTMVELRAVQEKLDAIDDERQAYAGVFAHRADVAGGWVGGSWGLLLACPAANLGH